MPIVRKMDNHIVITPLTPTLKLVAYCNENNGRKVIIGTHDKTWTNLSEEVMVELHDMFHNELSSRDLFTVGTATGMSTLTVKQEFDEFIYYVESWLSGYPPIPKHEAYIQVNFSEEPITLVYKDNRWAAAFTLDGTPYIRRDKSLIGILNQIVDAP